MEGYLLLRKVTRVMTNFKIYIATLCIVIFCLSCTDNDTTITPIALTG